MKVAVSIADDVFAEAEVLAKRLNTTRSDIVTRALREFIGHHASDPVAERLDDVVRDVGQEPDAFSIVAAQRALKKIEW